MIKLNNNLNAQPQFIYDANGQITGYKTKAGADTVFPFSKSEYIGMSAPVGSEMPSSNTVCMLADYNSDIVTYDASTGKMKLKKSSEVTVCIAHTPVGSQSNVIVSYQINNGAITPLITALGTSDLQTEKISVQKDDTLTVYYRCSVNRVRHIAVIELHCGI